MIRKETIYPENSCAHCADDGQHHGNCRISHPPHGARKQIHDAAEEVWDGGDGEYLQSALDHVRFSCVDSQNLGPKGPGTNAQNQ